MHQQKNEIKDLPSQWGWLKDDLIQIFVPFLAAVTCRLCGKSKESVSRAFTEKVIERFVQFYRPVMQMPSTLLPPSTFSLHILNLTLQGGKRLTETLFKFFLRAKLAYNTELNLLRILDYTLLLHTSMNGLNLIKQVEAAREACGFNDTFQFLTAIYLRGTKQSIRKIVEFYIKYHTAGGVAERGLYHWARLINPQYLSSFQVSNHKIMMNLLAALIESDTTKGVWNIRGMEIAPELKQKILDFAKAFKRCIREDLSQGQCLGHGI